MDSSGTNLPAIFEIYSRYCDIRKVTQDENGSSREQLNLLSKSLGSGCYRSSDKLFGDLYKLMSHLELSVDSHQFTRFYGFVFFICRENGQKNITVERALMAWRSVLTGRFRLLNQWCDFVEKHQRHNISEDNWNQLLAFSRCVHEDLEGYDPKGAWPVLIDEFVEHMYRIGHSTSCSSRDFCCNCGDMETQPSISSTLRGLKLLPGSKRRSFTNKEEREVESQCDNTTNSSFFLKSKRQKQMPDLDMNMYASSTDFQVDMNKHNSFGCINTSACAVEDNLSKGFEGGLSSGCSFQYGKNRV